MYRKKGGLSARAAHKVQAPAGGTSQAPPGAQPSGPAQQMPAQQMPAQPQAAAPVPFFNPAQYQNGTAAPALAAQEKAAGGWEDQNQNTVQGEQQGLDYTNYQGHHYGQEGAQAQHQSYHQNGALPGYEQDPSGQQTYQQNYQQETVNQQSYQQDVITQQSYQQEAQQSYQQEASSEQSYQQEPVPAQQEQAPEAAPLTLDPSGQWYWDYPAQQWLPYYAPAEEAAALLEQLSVAEEPRPLLPAMTAAQAFESFSQEEEEEARVAAPAEARQGYRQEEGQRGFQSDELVQQGFQQEVTTQQGFQQEAAAQQSYQPEIPVQQSYQPEIPAQQSYQQETPQALDNPGPVSLPAPDSQEAPPLPPPGPHRAPEASPRARPGPPDHQPLMSFSPGAPLVEEAEVYRHQDFQQEALQLHQPEVLQAEAPPPEERPAPPPPPLGPPDLVDHGPPHPALPPPGPVPAPDLTRAPQQPSPSSHDDHYAWYTDQHGMPDVTGGPSGQAQGKAPDILGAGSGVVHPVPTSDRNRFMETGQLEEDDEAVLGGGLGPALRDSREPSFASLPPMVGAEGGGPPLYTPHPASLAFPPAAPPPALAPSPAPPLPPMVGGNEPPPSMQRMVVGSSYSGTLEPRQPVEGRQARDPAPAAVAEARSEAAGSEHRTAEMMGAGPARPPAPLPTPGRDIAGEESAAADYRRGSREAWDSEEERDSEEEERPRRRHGGRRAASPGGRSDRHVVPPRAGRVTDRSYRSSTDRDAEDEQGRRRGEDRRRRAGGREGSPVSRRHAETHYDRRERERREEEDRRWREERRGARRAEEERSFRGGGGRRHVKQEYPEDDRSYMSESRPASRAGSVSQEAGRSFHSTSGGDPYARMIAEQTAAFQKQQWLYQLQMTNPQAYQAEMQRQQLQQAVQHMETALEDPQQGAANVAIYKQYWDQYGGQLERLRAEQPMMHHLLQHFRSNWWHLVPAVKTEPGLQEDRPVSAAPSASESIGAFGEPVTTNSFQARWTSEGNEPEISTIMSRETGLQEEQVVGRLTPLMFSRPHPCARLGPSGLLVKVEAASPRDGQSAAVELHSLAALLAHTPEHLELAGFPGPLKPGVTHKNDVIKFCERKIAGSRGRADLADRDSYVLLWEMLVLLLRQKGQVEGSDLAELLLRDSPEVTAGRSRASSHRGDRSERLEDTSSASSLVEVELVERPSHGGQEDNVVRFRDYLLHGNKAEGLEFAMRAGLWGHALFLASKMDQRTYAGVMTRFANGLAINDPLQTLYQLMSARMPSAMKQCADQRWGDWRPHLAMILSNPLPGSDINRRSMTTLGDSLLAKGQLHAAQFCYIVSAAEWGTFGRRSSKLVLLGAQAGDLTLQRFATTEAIQCTEVFEFVQRLADPQFSMPSLQPYKYLHCLRLLETGLAARAQDYLRQLAEWLATACTQVEQDPVPGWTLGVRHLAHRLKYLDPVYTTTAGELADIPDPDWLATLDAAVERLQGAAPDITAAAGAALDTTEYGEEQQVAEYEDQYMEYEGVHYRWDPALQQWQPLEQQAAVGWVEPACTQVEEAPAPAPSPERAEEPEPSEPAPDTSPPPALGWGAPPGPETDPFSLPPIPERRTSDIDPASSARRPSVVRQTSIGRSRQNSSSSPVPLPPMLTPGLAPPPVLSPPPAAREKPKEPEKKPPALVPGTGGKSLLDRVLPSWLKPKNQVHLPDDSKPSIVFDEASGRWMNTADGEEDTCAPAAPPPMMAAVAPAPPGAVPAAPINFRAGLTKRKGRGGYVDVLSQSGMAKPPSLAPGPAAFANGPALAQGGPALLDPANPPSPQGGPTSLDYGGAGGAPPMMMFNPGSMGGMADQPPAF